MSVPPPRPPRPRSLSGRARRVALWVALAWGAGWATPAAADTWQRPVPGPVGRPFALSGDPFAPGQHRGVDLRARAGAPVRAACPGRVVFAGRLPTGDRASSVRCGRWRVSYLPLRATRVRAGRVVVAGELLGWLAAGHGGLHVGVRREGRRWGYVDPAPLFGAARHPVPPVALRIPRRGPGRAPVPPQAPPVRARPRPAPVAAPAPGLAPWPVWAGLGLVLSGVAGGASLGRRRRRRERAVVRTSPAVRHAAR